jgi:hypothetical protein
MNIALELHDSRVESIQADDSGHVTLHFSAAYIHKSAGQPGVDSGTGYSQAASISFGKARYVGNPAECVGRISDGMITVNGHALSLSPIPFSFSGLVQAEFVFQNGALFKIDAHSVDCVCFGPCVFVDNFPGM